MARGAAGDRVVGLLADALRDTGSVIDELRPDRLLAPSPCSAWSVSDVVAHVVTVTDKFTRFARGETDTPGSRSADEIDPDPREAYRVAAAESFTAWRDHPDALNRVCRLPFGVFSGATVAAINLFDVVVHGWDIAAGGDVEHRVDEALAEFVLPIAIMLATPDARASGHYAEPSLVGVDASAPARLLAVTGRAATPRTTRPDKP